MILKTLSLAITFAVVGCAAPQQPVLSEEEQNSLEPVICHGQKHCDAMWQRAQIWVLNNAAYKIQIANDTVIQTYGPFKDQAFGLAFTVTKAPRGNGFYEIDSRSGCGSWVGCVPNPNKAKAALHMHLKATPGE